MIPVPRLWPGATVALLGAGPSLTRADVDACHGVVPVIAINRAVDWAPWANVLYACDEKLWHWIQGAPNFAGLKYGLHQAIPAAKWGVSVLQNTGPLGLELDPTGLRTGYNSGYQAINLAVHLGAARVVLLGYDMGPAADGRTHFHAPHPDEHRVPSPYPQMRAAFASLVEPLAALGVSVVNCSRQTTLEVFPRATLEDALLEVAA